jgi:hypothetical protein
MEVGLGFWASRTLLSAVEMGLFTELARQPSDLTALRSGLGLHQRSAADFLDALVALGFLQREAGIYRNSPDADRFLDKSKPTYIGGILEMASTRLYGFWNNLTEALWTGKNQNESKNGEADPFAALYADPKRLREFLRAMSGISRGANLAIAQNFPWAKYKSFVDAGTAQGDLAVQIAKANPHLTGVGIDLAKVAPIFTAYVAENELASRVSFTSGDFFKDPLPQTDVVLMGHILHDWSLEQKKALIKKAYAAVPEGGAMIVYDSIIDDDRCKNVFGLLMSLNMLIETPAGFDYTGADCRSWMKEAGFRETCIEHLVGPDSMVVGIK